MVTYKDSITKKKSLTKRERPIFEDSLKLKQPHFVSMPFTIVKIIANMNMVSKNVEIVPAPFLKIPVIRKTPVKNSSHGKNNAVKLIKE